MGRHGRGGCWRPSGARRTIRGYTIRGRYGRIDYVGVTNNPGRRASEHKRAGKRGKIKVETRAMSPASAKGWEAGRLANYRRTHRGSNPRYNRTRSGGWLY